MADSNDADPRGYEVVAARRTGEGGFLQLVRLRLRLVRGDGSRSSEGLYDVVERPMGLDAVVVVLYHCEGESVDVLLRTGPRVPLAFGRSGRLPAPGDPPIPLHHCTEIVAGILEQGEDGDAALFRRAAAEALEEAGLTVSPEAVVRLDAPLFPTPGMCAELFHFVACEVLDPATAVQPEGDGSPFEEGATLEWLPLDEAIAHCRSGTIDDMKTEVALLRLRDRLRGAR